MNWVWKRAKLVANDDDRQRIERLACIRLHTEPLQAHEVMVCADALDLRPNGPWLYKLSQLYHAPAVTAAVARLAATERVKVAA